MYFGGWASVVKGMMRILLQPLDAARDFQPFADVLTALDGDRCAAVATVVASNLSSLTPGSAWLKAGNDTKTYGVAEELRGAWNRF